VETPPASHAGGQGFESPHLHPAPSWGRADVPAPDAPTSTLPSREELARLLRWWRRLAREGLPGMGLVDPGARPADRRPYENGGSPRPPKARNDRAGRRRPGWVILPLRPTPAAARLETPARTAAGRDDATRARTGWRPARRPDDRRPASGGPCWPGRSPWRRSARWCWPPGRRRPRGGPPSAARRRPPPPGGAPPAARAIRAAGTPSPLTPPCCWPAGAGPGVLPGGAPGAGAVAGPADLRLLRDARALRAGLRHRDPRDGRRRVAGGGGAGGVHQRSAGGEPAVTAAAGPPPGLHPLRAPGGARARDRRSHRSASGDQAHHARASGSTARVERGPPRRAPGIVLGGDPWPRPPHRRQPSCSD
jgi:hypothetical protein